MLESEGLAQTPPQPLFLTSATLTPNTDLALRVGKNIRHKDEGKKMAV
jgi:hypothetical protein